MKDDPLNRQSLMFLMSSLCAALLLHIDRLPIWMIALAAGVMYWRFMIFRGRVSSPHWSLKGCLVVLGFVGIYITYGKQFSIESMTSLLVAGFILKPLEVSKRQDSYLLIFLSYLLISLYFLFDQSPLGYLGVLTVLIVTLATQITVNSEAQISAEHPQLKKQRSGPIWQALLLFIKSLPLALFLFFILPRLGPLWSMNISTQAGTIGLSDSMSPGDVAELGKSDELAFRVKFLTEEPNVKQLYWRALVLDYFDGEQWSQKYKPEVSWAGSGLGPSNTSKTSSFEIILEPHEQRWLYSLGVSNPITKGIGVRDDGLLIAKDKIRNPWLYRAVANFDARLDTIELGERERFAYLQVPKVGNERSQQFARKLKQELNSPLLMVDALRQFIGGQKFTYTLSPGALDSDSTIDEFLFETQRGFCAHFAGSVVYLLRAAGIPSRVVLGYQGAEDNPVAGFHSVYQYNAHAWVELWIEGQGWQRIDPTAWVSPERIEQGVESALKNEFTGFSSGSSWINSMRNQFNALNYYWQDWMLNYKGDAQQKLISDLLGDREQYEMIAIYLVCFFGLVGAGFLTLLFDFKFKKLSFAQRINEQYGAILKGLGLPPLKSMTVSQISAEILIKAPKLKPEVSEIKSRMEMILYANVDGGMLKKDYLELKGLIKSLSKKLPKEARL
jgi:transglutaminase-like putative cysteine protease